MNYPFFLRRPVQAPPRPAQPRPPQGGMGFTGPPEFVKEFELIVTGAHTTKLSIVNEKGAPVDTQRIENVEQAMAEAYIEPNDVVLELGARYGSVSCRINLKLADKTKQVSVEPDERVWEALEKNKDANQCQFHILKGCISNAPRVLIHPQSANGYGATTAHHANSTMPHFTLEEVKQKFGIETFTVVFADCEGCLDYFLKENPTLLDSLRLFIFEADYPHNCNYDDIVKSLQEKGFVEVKQGFHSVWRQGSSPSTIFGEKSISDSNV